MKLDGLIPCFLLVSSTTWCQLPPSYLSTSLSYLWPPIPSKVFIAGIQANILYPLLSCNMHAACPASLGIRTTNITYSFGRWVGLTTLPHSCTDCLENWEPQLPSVPVQACRGIALPLVQLARRSQQPRCKVWAYPGRLLGLWVRIPPIAWMYLSLKMCVLSGTGLCVWMITRPVESYRVWCVWVW